MRFPLPLWIPALALLVACERYERLEVEPPSALMTHYLTDFQYELDPTTGIATMGHLLVFNPSTRAVDLTITAFFENEEPKSFSMRAEAGCTSESNYRNWPISPGQRFALKVESPIPVVVQATLGWNNTANLYAPTAPTQDPQQREAATSYLSVPAPATRWYVADGIVLDKPSDLWIRESEWAVLLNPGDASAHVQLGLFYRLLMREHDVDVPPRRVKTVRLDDLVLLPNKHYGVRITSDQPIVVQWRRHVYWNNSPSLMSFWSMPALALAEAK